ncbi:DUF1616 domain-containing protein [Natronolimnohabitans sp. A-GB9]|uniref:DUF1616 domain-containing protein n=1 Tax=Natronolimnohabitans sp. A-GB9 TaxID=3069757 RepID=UPI0027B7A626|nr:DUF1616 domain-containing protein [Natronolimnohabitans sp. A-GB9]MDQ2052619.1 DUF1616 domain-containing protein [Natronolimnohabitans sp. A-GB9]
MVDSRTLVAMLPRPVRTMPADLAAVFVFVALTNVAVLAPVVRETPLRIPLGLAFVLFVPGYAFIAALFPEAGTSPAAATDASTADAEATAEATDGGTETGGTLTGALAGDRSGIDGIERVALSFGLSIAITPLLGLVLNFTPWGIRLVPIMVAVSAFTVVAAAVAVVRRRALPAEERFRVPYRSWYAAGQSELLEPDTRADAVLNVVLVLSIVLAVGSVGYAVMVPPDGEQFSAVYVLTEDDDGDLVADDYPTEFTVGESQPVVVGVDNHEHESVDYTVVALEQAVSVEGGNQSAIEENATANVSDVTVEEQRELERFETQLAHNETWHHTHDLEPTLTGEDVRLVWLLFPDGEVPDEPSMDDTEYSVHLWVDVEEP